MELSGAGSGTITIDGSSPSTPVTLQAAIKNRLFQIDSGVQTVITNLNLENGDVRFGNATNKNGGAILNAGTLTLSNANISASGTSYGGAIENDGTMTISNTIFTSNIASNSGGAIENDGTLKVSDSTFTSNSGAFAGGIANFGMVSLANTTFSDNSAANSGGAIYNGTSAALTINGGFFTATTPHTGALQNYSGTATLSGVAFSGNRDSTSGGAVDNYAGPLMLTNTTLAGNYAGYGGALYNNANSNVTMSDSAVSGNTANTAGGGLYNGGTLTLNDATVAANVSDGVGGGIENHGGMLSDNSATIAENTAYGGGGGIDSSGTLAVRTRSWSPMRLDSAATVSISSAPSRPIRVTTYWEQRSTTQRMTPIPVRVTSSATRLCRAARRLRRQHSALALLVGSPAIGAGNANAANPPTDQRGFPRVVNGRLDIGDFQTQPPTLAFTTLGQSADAGKPMTITLNWRIWTAIPSRPAAAA